MKIIPDKIRLLNKKLYSGVILGFLIAVLIALFSSYNIIRYVTAMHGELQTLFEKDFMGQNNIQDARINLLYIDRELKTFFIEDNDLDRKASIGKINKLKKYLAEHVKKANPLFYSKKGAEKIKRAQKALSDYTEILDATIVLSGKSKTKAIALSFKDTKSRFDYLDNLLSELNNIKQKKDLQTYRSMILRYETTFFVTIILLVLTIIFRIILAIKDHKKMIAD